MYLEKVLNQTHVGGFNLVSEKNLSMSDFIAIQIEIWCLTLLQFRLRFINPKLNNYGIGVKTSRKFIKILGYFNSIWNTYTVPKNIIFNMMFSTILNIWTKHQY